MKIFSNENQFYQWINRNCKECIKLNCSLKSKIQFNTIPKYITKSIGIHSITVYQNVTNQYCRLNNCNEKRKI